MIKRSTDEWRALFSEQAHSGQSAAVFCRERGLCSKHFSKRRQQLFHPGVGTPVPKSAFIPVTLTPPQASARVELQLGDALVLIFPSCLSPAWLADLIRQLRV